MLENLEPKSVMYYFEEISKIPRGSGNEKGISDYIANFAKEHNLEYIQDEYNNVIVKKGSTNNSDNTIILQAHIDMVCEKNKDVHHDFLKDPIKLKIDEDFIKAEGTTLGADNGIGVAYNLAILSNQNIIHPNIECLFTADEEVGMTGAKAVDFDKLSGNKLINIDSEDEGIITCGCAGGIRINLKYNLNYKQIEVPEEYKTYELEVKGLKGGHSGIDINKNRENAIKILAEMLKELSNVDTNFKISNIEGGMKDNAIPREAFATILIEHCNMEEALSRVDEISKKIVSKYIENEKDIQVSINEAKEAKKHHIDEEIVDKIISTINETRNGVNTMSDDVTGLVESSSNMGVIRTKEDYIEINILPRSSKGEILDEIIVHVKSVAEKYDFSQINTMNPYPSWDFQKDSELRLVAVEVFEEIYNKKAIVDIIHAGLECAVFKDKKDSLDLISMGPNIYDPHTPDERVSISSVQRTWEYIIKVLERL